MARPKKNNLTTDVIIDEVIEELPDNHIEPEIVIPVQTDDEKAQLVFGNNKNQLGRYRYLRKFSVLKHEEAVAWVLRKIK